MGPHSLLLLLLLLSPVPASFSGVALFLGEGRREGGRGGGNRERGVVRQEDGIV
jgi:hypothetical protein